MRVVLRVWRYQGAWQVQCSMHARMHTRTHAHAHTPCGSNLFSATNSNWHTFHTRTTQVVNECERCWSQQQPVTSSFSHTTHINLDLVDDVTGDFSLWVRSASQTAAAGSASMFTTSRHTSPHHTPLHLTTPHHTSPHLTHPTAPHLTSPHPTPPPTDGSPYVHQ